MAAGSVNVTGLLSTQAAPMQYDYSKCGASLDNNFLHVDLNNPNDQYNQTKLFEGTRSDFAEVPPGLGAADTDRIIALREVLFVYQNRAMVKVTEFYPNSGRVYYNHYNWEKWAGWYSPDVTILGTPNPNMLINYDFTDPINQRGKKEYAGVNYGIDCWNGYWTGAGVINLVNPGTADGCISLFRSQYSAHMVQFIEGAEALAGKTVTFSSLMKNDSGGLCGIGLYGKTSADSDYVKIKSTSMNFETYTPLSVTGTVPAGITNLLVDITSSNGVKSYTKAAKLELGNRQTLAHQDADGNWVLNDPPPDKALELLNCKRYYQRYGCGITGLVHEVHADTGLHKVLFTFPFPVEMRTTPSVKLVGDTIRLFDVANGLSLELRDLSISIGFTQNVGMNAVVVEGRLYKEDAAEAYTVAYVPTRGAAMRLNQGKDVFELSADL